MRVSTTNDTSSENRLAEASTDITELGDRTAATPRIHRLGGEDLSFGAELRTIALDLWHSRDLIHQLTLRDIRIRYKQAVMGFGWALFMPMLIVLSGVLVRFAMAQTSGRSLDVTTIAGMAVKALPWAFFVGAIGLATSSLIGNMNLLTKIYFPREVLPFSTLLAQCFDTLIGGTVLTLMLPFLGAQLSLQLLWVPVLLLLLFTFVLGCTFFLSCANLFFRDVKYIVQVLLTFGIFVTPIFYEPSMFGPRVAQLLMLNPLAPIMEGLRFVVVDAHNLATTLVMKNPRGVEVLAWTPWYLVYSAVWGIGGALVSLRLFRRAAYKFAEYA